MVFVGHLRENCCVYRDFLRNLKSQYLIKISGSKQAILLLYQSFGW